MSAQPSDFALRERAVIVVPNCRFGQLHGA